MDFDGFVRVFGMSFWVIPPCNCKNGKVCFDCAGAVGSHVRLSGGTRISSKICLIFVFFFELGHRGGFLCTLALFLDAFWLRFGGVLDTKPDQGPQKARSGK